MFGLETAQFCTFSKERNDTKMSWTDREQNDEVINRSGTKCYGDELNLTGLFRWDKWANLSSEIVAFFGFSKAATVQKFAHVPHFGFLTVATDG